MPAKAPASLAQRPNGVCAQSLWLLRECCFLALVPGPLLTGSRTSPVRVLSTILVSQWPTRGVSGECGEALLAAPVPPAWPLLTY